MSYSVKILADSLSPGGVRLTTMEVTLPRIVLAEFNTHRALSRSSASSRAIPVEKRIRMVLENPYVPDEFGSNQRGMQSGDPLAGSDHARVREAWVSAANFACLQANDLAEAGVHKEYANRLLEPFLWHTIIVSATEWENFFALRCHRDASRPIRVAAEMMRDAMKASRPRDLLYGSWHTPFVKEAEEGGIDWVKVSIGRCARASYLTHDGKRDPAADVALFDRLVSSGHMSPLEHVARPATVKDADLGHIDVKSIKLVGTSIRPELLRFGNFRGWVQYRKLVPGEDVFTGVSSSPSVGP